jgi:predicted O-methyltransferase YrrM
MPTKRLLELLDVPRMGVTCAQVYNTPVPPGARLAEIDPCGCVEGLIDLLEEVGVEGKDVVEVGCFLGVSTETILQFSPRRVYAIDAWGLKNDYNDIKYLPHLNFGDIEARFREMAKGYKNIEVIKNLSVAASHGFGDESLDFVYIDAEHTYDGVRADIHAWLPKVRKGGFIGGHDYTIDTVYQAVHSIEAFKHKRVRDYKDTSWLVKLD